MLVQRLFSVTRSKAQGLIQTGCVLAADGTALTKPGARVPADAALTLRERPKFVSRGGDKLEAAFRAFPINPVIILSSPAEIRNLILSGGQDETAMNERRPESILRRTEWG